MKTIAKNRLDQFIPRIRNVRVFSLDNYFAGETAKDDGAAVAFARKVDAKFQWDAATLKGRARAHSNLWYEFDVSPS